MRNPANKKHNDKIIANLSKFIKHNKKLIHIKLD
jgi:hypothetical protein